ncbi:MAG: UDP-N-acetylmuramoyl-L-alanine--D-glutamate ligase [Patescibacteria group bacterium]
MITLKKKNVLVMGLGLHGGGVGVVKFLSRRGARVTVTDMKPQSALGSSLKALKDARNIRYVLGGHREEDFMTSDIIIKNPDVPASSPYLAIAKKRGIPILTDIGIFFMECRGIIIGITGTKGKSTAATLIHAVLSKKYTTYLGGNIRKSVLEFLPRMKKTDIAVLELSSFQLEDLASLRVSPHIAILTSLFPDHLNRHGTFQKYADAKKTIFRFQKRGDVVIANGDDARLRTITVRVPGKKILVSKDNPFRETATAVNPLFRGTFLYSALFAREVAKIFRISDRVFLETLRRFKGLPGRKEVVLEKAGTIWINDTTATAPGAAAETLKEISESHRGKNIILIAGGPTKKLPPGILRNAIRKYATRVIFLPGAFSDSLKKNLRVPFSDVLSMEEAVRLARGYARHDGVVLLSPGSASFGIFKHEFDRGKRFVRAVKKSHYENR